MVIIFTSSFIDYYGRTVILLLRITRGIKLHRTWKVFRDILGIVWSSIQDILLCAIILTLFIIFYVIIGMELYANKVKFNDNGDLDLVNGTSIVFNFDNVGNAFQIVFTLLIGENWSFLFLYYQRASPVVSIIYFYSATIILSIFLVNLLVGIMLQNFFENEQVKNLQEEDRLNKEFEEMQKQAKRTTKVEKYRHKQGTLLGLLKTFRAIIKLKQDCQGKRRTEKVETDLVGDSLEIFSNESELRRILSKIVVHWGFKLVIYLAIVLNSVSLTLQVPIYDPNGTVMAVAYDIDIATSALFCSEVIMKVITYGLAFNGPDSYLQSPWNILDIVTTIASIIGLGSTNYPRAVYEILMIFRLLRILRFFTIKEGFVLCIRAILQGFSKIIQVLGMTLFFFAAFAIIGIHLYKGMLYYCDVGSLENYNVVVNDVYDCMNQGGEWRTQDFGFDDTITCLITLFELFTGKCWWDLVIDLQDSNGIDMAPVSGANATSAWFLVVFMIAGFLFLRTVLTGVITSTFFEKKEEIQGYKNLTSAQIRWVRLSKIMFKAHPRKEVSLM